MVRERPIINGLGARFFCYGFQGRNRRGRPFAIRDLSRYGTNKNGAQWAPSLHLEEKTD